MNLIQLFCQERGRCRTLDAHLRVSIGRITQLAATGLSREYMQIIWDFTDRVVSLKSVFNVRTTRELGVINLTVNVQMTKAVGAGLLKRQLLSCRADERGRR